MQTAWTSFDPYLYSGGSSSAGPALVEIATVRSFILIVTDTMSATPLEPLFYAELLVKTTAERLPVEIEI